MTNQPLANKLALITSTGQTTADTTAHAIAAELAHQGAAVVLHNASPSAIQAITAAGGRAFTVTGDLTHIPDCFRIVDEAATRLGGLDILVNAAEITTPMPLLNVAPADFDHLLNTNMRAAFFCAQQALGWLHARGGGNIINIGSVAAFAGIPNTSLYAATKGAIAGFTRQLAIELIPHNIRVNAIAPGALTTADPTTADPAANAPIAQNTWGRTGQPADIARMVAFIVADAANFITGQILYLDGGLTSRLAIYPPLINTQELPSPPP